MKRALTALALALAACLAALPLQAAAAPFAYVPNEGSGTLSVIDTATDQVVADIAVGARPRGTAIAPDGSTADVSDQPNAAIVVVDLAARKRSATIAVGASPEGVGISADGRWVVAAVEETNEIVFVDTRTNAKAFAVKVRGQNPEHAVFGPDGRYVFVSAEEGQAVDSRRAYVAAETSNEVYVIDAQKFTLLSKLKAGLRSNGVALHPDGRRRLCVSNGGNATVSAIDLASGAAVATIGVGQRPWNMALTPDGRKLYVACGRSASVAVIDTEKNAKIAEIPVGKLPWGVANR